MKIIPFYPSVSSHQNFNVNLGELVCDFTFNWNLRLERWFCDFKTSSGENLSVCVIENSPLLGNSNRTGLSGDFRAVKVNKLCNDGITYDNLGSDWAFVYGTSEEWSIFDAGV